jgi:hypothetical protein
MKYKDKNIYVSIAPEPNDIFWENLGLKLHKRLKRRLITWFYTLVALGISFALIFGTSYYQT